MAEILDQEEIDRILAEASEIGKEDFNNFSKDLIPFDDKTTHFKTYYIKKRKIINIRLCKIRNKGSKEEFKRCAEVTFDDNKKTFLEVEKDGKIYYEIIEYNSEMDILNIFPEHCLFKSSIEEHCISPRDKNNIILDNLK